MKTYDSRPDMVDECRCGSQKSTSAKTCQRCFNEIRKTLGVTRDPLDWRKWVAAC